MTVKLLTVQHLEFLSLKGGCTGWSESIHVKMPHCWKSHVETHLILPEPELFLLFSLIISTVSLSLGALDDSLLSLV